MCGRASLAWSRPESLAPSPSRGVRRAAAAGPGRGRQASQQPAAQAALVVLSLRLPLSARSSVTPGAKWGICQRLGPLAASLPVAPLSGTGSGARAVARTSVPDVPWPLARALNAAPSQPAGRAAAAPPAARALVLLVSGIMINHTGANLKCHR